MMATNATIPIQLIFNGYKPLWCLPSFNLYDKDFDEESSKIYTDHIQRRPGKGPPSIKKRKEQFRVTEGQGKPIMKIEYYNLDRFNINDGHNRSGILAKKGEKSLTFVCSGEIKKEWKERCARVNEAYEEIISRHSKPKLYQPVDMLPGNETERSSYDRIKYIAQAMYPPEAFQVHPRGQMPHTLQSKKILDIGSNIGFFTNWLTRMGQEAIGIDPSGPKHEYSKMLTKAYGLSTTFHNIVFQDFDEEVDGMLDLSCCWHLMWTHKKLTEKEFIGKINKQCREFLISEVKSNYVDRYIELVTKKTHLTNMSVIGSSEYFQDSGGRQLLLFCAQEAIYPIPSSYLASVLGEQ